jgi:hypothetical protein
MQIYLWLILDLYDHGSVSAVVKVGKDYPGFGVFHNLQILSCESLLCIRRSLVSNTECARL